MKVYLECWWFGKRTICLEVDNATPDMTINDLLVIYFNKVILPSGPNTNMNIALGKMGLCGKNDFMYDKSKKLSFYNIQDGAAFTVLAGFSY